MYDNIIIVDASNKKEILENSLDDKTYIFSLENYISESIDVCNTRIFEELSDLINYIKKANAVFLVPFTSHSDDSLFLMLINNLDIKSYFVLDFDINEIDVIEQSFKNAKHIGEQEVEALKAKFEITKIFKCQIAPIILWSLHKNKLIRDSELRELTISLPALMALVKIVEVEDRIDTFTPKLYHRIGVDYTVDKQQFGLSHKRKFSKEDEDERESLYNRVSNPENMHIITDLVRETKNVPPQDPLNTQTLQKDASRKFDFSPSHTIKLAQDLREGKFDIGDGSYIGPLITSVYTKSKKIHSEVAYSVSELIIRKFEENGPQENVLEYQYLYGGTRDNLTVSEEEHEKEAIRPLYFSDDYFPKSLKNIMSEDHYKLYMLIFYRTIAVFMKDSLYDKSVLTVQVEAKNLKWKQIICLWWMEFLKRDGKSWVL